MPSDPRYGTAYQALRRVYAAVVERGDATCSEPICLKKSRHIAPGSPWHLSHDPTGTRILGPSHRACNVTEAGIRGRAKQANRFLQL